MYVSQFWIVSLACVAVTNAVATIQHDELQLHESDDSCFIRTSTTKQKPWCACTQVRSAEECDYERALVPSFSKDYRLHGMFYCCKWHSPMYLPKALVGRATRCSRKGAWSAFLRGETNKLFYKRPHRKAKVLGCSFHVRNSATQYADGKACSGPGQCAMHCCCEDKNDQTAAVCRPPGYCISNGFQCKENSLKPTLGELSEKRLDLYKWTRVATLHRAISFWWPTFAFSRACYVNRTISDFFGKAVIVRLADSIRDEALNMRAFHWSVTYEKSPYKLHVKEEALSGMAPPIDNIYWNQKVGISSCAEANGPADSSFLKFLVELWGGTPDGLHVTPDMIGKHSFGRSCKLTYVITANVDGAIELRTANMQKFHAGVGCGDWETVMDMNGKHAFLNNFGDYVLWAGEAWLQLSEFAVDECASRESSSEHEAGNGAVEIKGVVSQDMIDCLRKTVSADVRHVTFVINNDSGTFKPSGDEHVRAQVASLLKNAFSANVHVCNAKGIDNVKDDVWCPLQTKLYEEDLLATLLGRARPPASDLNVSSSD